MATRLLDAVLRWWDADTSPTTRRSIYDNPDTAEAYLIEAGIITVADFSAAIDRPAKSAALIGAIIDFALHGAPPSRRPVTARSMATLLGEPALTGEHLLAMTRAAHLIGAHRDGLMLAICSHPAADDDALTAALWNTGREHAALVAARTGSLLPAAVGWFRTHRIARRPGTGFPTAEEHHQIGELAAEWTTWAAGDGARTAFLTHHWSDFTTIDELFAVGAALVAAPSGP